jgi:hypothetical protein
LVLIITNIKVSSNPVRVKKPGWGNNLEQRWDRRNNDN